MRREDGEVRISASGERISPRVEEIVAALLGDRLEHDTAALLDPGRSVEVGESWALDRTLTRRFLAEKGVRAIRFDGTPTATLARESDALVVRYQIPVDWLELVDMPPNTHAARSRALLEGEIRLPDDRHASAISHTASLGLSMNGSVMKYGVVRSFPWRLESSRSWTESVQLLQELSAR